MRKKVFEIILQIIEENCLASKVEVITEDCTLTNDLGFDSFNLAQLTVNIESEFGVDIFENGVVYTVGDILKKVE
jgi:acyl carrier protein